VEEALGEFDNDFDELLKQLRCEHAIVGRNWKALSPQDKAALVAGGLSKPVVAALDEEFCTPLAIVHPHGITTVGNWFDSGAGLKKRLCDAGFPLPMYEQVRRGLMTPAFRCADVARFLKGRGDTERHGEAATIYEQAMFLDKIWFLDDRDCLMLCENYQEMVELVHHGEPHRPVFVGDAREEPNSQACPQGLSQR
jgi:hypothetical protein